MADKQNSILYIPHGGGPLPLLDHDGHKEMISFLKDIPASIQTPSAIIVISAHWETDEVSITAANNPPLIYDYSGFPQETYDLQYPAPGNVDLAKKIHTLFQNNNISANLDEQRGFDHGMFVPLTLMYPEAHIPCIQISLVKGLDPKTHIDIGRTLSALKDENILVLGSGMSFHNMRSFGSSDIDKDNQLFEDWLIDTCTNPTMTESEREQRLLNWSDAPGARNCHPREEHLIPLHVCYGMAQSNAKLVFDGKVMNKKTSAYLW